MSYWLGGSTGTKINSWFRVVADALVFVVAAAVVVFVVVTAAAVVVVVAAAAAVVAGAVVFQVFVFVVLVLTEAPSRVCSCNFLSYFFPGNLRTWA